MARPTTVRRWRLLGRICAVTVAAFVGLLLLRGIGLAVGERQFEADGRANLSRLYAISNQLRFGMTPGEVRSILAQSPQQGIQLLTHQNGDQALLAYIGLADVCQLSVTFQQGRLVRTHIIGEDGPHDLCPDAPQPILGGEVSGAEPMRLAGEQSVAPDEVRDGKARGPRK